MNATRRRVNLLSAIALSAIGVVLLAIALTPSDEAIGQIQETPTPTPAATSTAVPAPTPVPAQLVVKEPEPALSRTHTFILVAVPPIAAVLLLGAAIWGLVNLEAKGQGASDLPRTMFETVFQAAALIAVVVSVFILGLQGKITDQGLVAIFSSIVGYVLGRASGPVLGRGG